MDGFLRVACGGVIDGGCPVAVLVPFSAI